MALNWLRAKPGVIPLLGVRTLGQLEDNLGCVAFKLSDEQMHHLDEASVFSARYLHSYLAKTKPLAYAGFEDRLDI